MAPWRKPGWQKSVKLRCLKWFEVVAIWKCHSKFDGKWEKPGEIWSPDREDALQNARHFQIVQWMQQLSSARQISCTFATSEGMKNAYRSPLYSCVVSHSHWLVWASRQLDWDWPCADSTSLIDVTAVDADWWQSGRGGKSSTFVASG